jgi:hypothetical protein
MFKIILGATNVFIGIIWFFLAWIILSGIPNAIERWSQEYEDVIGLLFFFGLTGFLGFMGILLGISLMRGKLSGKVSKGAAIIYSWMGISLLTSFSLFDLLTNDPATQGFKYCLIPALIMVFSLNILKKNVLKTEDNEHSG